MGWQLVVLILLVISGAGARAQELPCVFIAPSKPLPAGGRGSLWLYCMNNSSQVVSRTFEPRLTGTLSSGSGSFATVLLLATNTSAVTAAIAPGGFVKEEYLVDLPPTNLGPVTVVVSNYNPVVILVEPAAAGVAASTPQPLKVDLAKTTPDSVFRDYINSHLFFYEPIYFILGSYPAAEFQLSLKYKLLSLTDSWNPATHLYVAYTQTSFWDVITKNPSFYDTSYKPSVFLYYPGVLHNDAFHLDLQSGAEHESNGRGGAMERSLNTAYVQPTATFELPYHVQFMLQPRAWFYIAVNANNPDLPDYRGYADLLTALTWTNPNCGEKIQFATKLLIGDEGSHAGLQFVLRFNLAAVPVLHNFNPSIQVQYFTGYGQTLRQYNETSHAVRGGLCLWY